MSVAFGRLSAQIVFQTVATVEKFANVTSYVVLEDKAPTWVLVGEPFDIKN